MADAFSKKVREELRELKEDYEQLEGKYENLQEEHDRLREETGEHTSMRISAIEEEIESMNTRVEKLATDSYAIHSEVRDIHESVLEMRSALSDIVSLYKAILGRYGAGMAPKGTVPPRTKGIPQETMASDEERGDAIIKALREEKAAKERARGGRATQPPLSRTVPPKPTKVSPAAPPAPLPPPAQQPPVQEEPAHPLDELHRLSEGETDVDTATLAERLAARSSRDDRVGRVARRDMGRRETVSTEGEGEFTKALPRKELARARPGPRGGDDGWEPTAPPEGVEPREPRRKKRLEDLLSPE